MKKYEGTNEDARAWLLERGYKVTEKNKMELIPKAKRK